MTFVQLQSTNEDICYEIWEVSVSPLTADASITFKAQKGIKDIIEVVHVTPVV